MNAATTTAEKSALFSAFCDAANAHAEMVRALAAAPAPELREPDIEFRSKYLGADVRVVYEHERIDRECGVLYENYICNAVWIQTYERNLLGGMKLVSEWDATAHLNDTALEKVEEEAQALLRGRT